MGEFTEAPLCQAWGGGTNTKGGGAALKVLQRKCPFWWLQSLYGLLLPLFTDGDSEAEEGHPACSSCHLEGVGVPIVTQWLIQLGTMRLWVQSLALLSGLKNAALP